MQAVSNGAGDSKNSALETELRRYKADVDRLTKELRHETTIAEDLASELSGLRQTTVPIARERDLEAKIDRLQREADSNHRKLQVSRLFLSVFCLNQKITTNTMKENDEGGERIKYISLLTIYRKLRLWIGHII